ncbi:MAG: mandelate racemase/muconate lactonizing enzyme family protein [Rhodospirillaceae bacterium]
MTKITKIDVIRTAVPFETGGPRQGMRPGLNNNPWLAKESLMIRMETADGIEGWGECFGHFAAMAVEAVLIELIAPWFIGRDTDDFETVMDQAHKSFFGFGRNGPIMFALSGLDIALWDIRAKRANKPLYQVLGGPVGDVTLTRYASLMRYGGDTDAVARNTTKAADLGFPMVKLHERDMPSFLAARDAAPEGVDITLDVNCPWTVEEACQVARDLKAYENRRGGFLWLEEPVWPPEDFDGSARVRQEGTAISGGENIASTVEFKRAIEAGAFDIVQPSVSKMGGVSCMKDVFPLCREANLRCMPHSFYWGPGYVASAHILAAQEGQGADAPDWVETGFITFEENPHDLMDPMNPKLVLKADRPGLGFEPRPVLFDKFLVRRSAIAD